MTEMPQVGGDVRALSDAELITSVRAGSDAAFAVLYERHNGSARAAARSLGASRADVDAFASLPERWQMVLWHTEVEGRPAADVGPLLGLAPNAVAALAYRAREGLRQAYLQAHLQLPPPDACRDTIAKLGAYVRDGLSARDRRKVDEHLKQCERCTAVLLELQEVSTSLRGVLLPVLLGVAGSAFLANLGAGGGAVLALLRWRPRTPMAQAGVVAATAAAVVASVVGVAT